MRHVGVRTLAVIAVGAAVLAGVLWVASNIDGRPPNVAGYRLTQGLPGDSRIALITTSVEIAFSEPVDEASAAAALRVEPAVEGSASWSGSTLTFTPAEPLPLETEFVIQVVAGVVDRAGNAMTEDAPAFAFATAGRPAVAETDPVDAGVDVPLDGPIVLVFSTFMDTASVEAGLRVRPAFGHELRWSGERLEILPTVPLRPGERYVVSLSGSAADIAGVALEDDFNLTFDTVSTELRPATVVPADGSDGIAVTTPVAAMFEVPLNPDSISSADLTITPSVAGSFDVVAAAGDDPEVARVVRFVPSSPLPANTTFSIELGPGLEDTDGAQLAAAVEWTFTTGAPAATLGNQIVFLSERSGVANLWAMNHDGTGQRQLSAELAPILDFAVAPDGRTFVVGDGRQLVLQQADGGGRRVLTDAGLLEFDPAFSPDGRRIAFARADAESGEGMGLWERGDDGGDDRHLELPQEVGATPSPSPSEGDDPPAAQLLRAPRYAPDGQALAYVDAAGRVGIVELPAERLTTTAFNGVVPPTWLPDSSGVLVAGTTRRDTLPGLPPGGPVVPLDPLIPTDEPIPDASRFVIAFLPRSGPDLAETTLGPRAAAMTVDSGGRVVVIRLGEGADEARAGRLYLAVGMRGVPRLVEATRQELVRAAAFGPEASELALELADEHGSSLGIWGVDLDTQTLERLSVDGQRPRWLP